MHILFVLLVVAAITCIPSCGPTVEVDPAPDGGMGGAGGKEVASSSSSSSSGQMCDPEYVIAVCDMCKVMGCPMPKDLDEPCSRIGTIHYTDMIGCAQLYPGACPACKGITAGMPISLECEECSKPLSKCSFDCTFAVTGGNS